MKFRFSLSFGLSDRSRRTATVALQCIPLLLMLACATTTPLASPAPGPPSMSAPPAASVQSSSLKGAPTSAPAPAAPEATAPTEAPSVPPEPSPEPSSPKLSQEPVNLVTARDVAFLIDYDNSTPKKTAEAACEKEAEGDPKMFAECLDKHRNQFKADVLRFVKDESGRITLTIYKRTGTSLNELSVSSIQFLDETDTSVSVKLTGKNKGQRPLFKSGVGSITVPNEYTIEIDDKDLGKLSYSAKIGLVSQ
jgi:hypothetical protein